MLHFQVRSDFRKRKTNHICFLKSLACRPELHEYTKYAYDLFSNESLQSPSRTAYSFLPSSSSSLQSNLSSFLQSLMSP